MLLRAYEIKYNSLAKLPAHSLAAAMTAKDMVMQIEGCSSFFDTQSRILTPSQVSESKAAMARSLEAQILSLRMLDIAGATLINTAIVQSNFDIENKTLLAAAVNAKTNSAGAPTTSNAKKVPQTMPSVLNYLTEKDWHALGTSTSTSQRIIIIGDRMMALDMTHPSETTIKHLVALLACCSMPTADANTLHGLVGELKSHLVSRRPSDPVPTTHLATYPDSPADLQPDLYTRAYGADMPIDKTDELSSVWRGIVNRVPLRSSNKQLGSTAAASSSHHNSAASAITMLLQHLGMRSGEEGGLPNLVIHPPRVQTAPKVPALAATAGLASRLGSSPGQAIGRPLAIADGPTSLGAASGDVQDVAPPIGGGNAITASGAPALHKAIMDREGDDGGAQGGISASGTGASKDDGEPPAGASEKSDIIDQLESIASGKYPAGKSKAKAKAKRTGKGPPDASHADSEGSANAALKRPAASDAEDASIHKKPAGSTTMLGCPKCRGCPKGCIQCRDPAYKGNRFQRTW